MKPVKCTNITPVVCRNLSSRCSSMKEQCELQVTAQIITFHPQKHDFCAETHSNFPGIYSLLLKLEVWGS